MCLSYSCTRDGSQDKNSACNCPHNPPAVRHSEQGFLQGGAKGFSNLASKREGGRKNEGGGEGKRNRRDEGREGGREMSEEREEEKKREMMGGEEVNGGGDEREPLPLQGIH